jgi:hypothetical protein
MQATDKKKKEEEMQTHNKHCSTRGTSACLRGVNQKPINYLASLGYFFSFFFMVRRGVLIDHKIKMANQSI